MLNFLILPTNSFTCPFFGTSFFPELYPHGKISRTKIFLRIGAVDLS
jgi:hypothetical protein